MVDATDISTSRPSDVYSTPSERSTRSLWRRFTMLMTRRPAGPHQVDGAVGVGGRARLADRHDQRVATCPSAAGSRTARWRARASARSRPAGTSAPSASTRPWPATAAVPWPITSTWVMRPASRSATTASGRVSGPRRTLRPAVRPLHQPAPQRLAERRGRLADLLEQEVRVLATVDVAGRDLGGHQLAGCDRQLGPVVGPALGGRRACRRGWRRAGGSGRGCRPGCRDRPGLSPSIRR